MSVLKVQPFESVVTAGLTLFFEPFGRPRAVRWARTGVGDLSCFVVDGFSLFGDPGGRPTRFVVTGGAAV